MHHPEPSHAPGEVGDQVRAVAAADERDERIIRRAAFAYRSCLFAMFATVVLVGVILGWTRFAWVGAVLGTIVIYLGCVVFGLLGMVVFAAVAPVIAWVQSAATKPKRRASASHPLGDDELDGPAR